MIKSADEVDALIDKLTDALAEERMQHDTEVEALNSENSSLEDKVTELDDQLREIKEVEGPINAFLDLLERSVGTQKFIVPDGPAKDAAILGLYDAIGRGL